MPPLTNLFKLLELTRSMPQSGYALIGVEKGRLSDLAQHQYLVAMIAWQLARNANRQGAGLNTEKVLELALAHDLGELFGGDIAMPYAQVNKKAKKSAKAFEAENQKYLAKLFGQDKKHMEGLFKEVMDPKTPEALLVKFADYLECGHYRFYIQKMDKKDFELNLEKINSYLKKIKNSALKKYLSEFLQEWSKAYFEGYGEHNIIKLINN